MVVGLVCAVGTSLSYGVGSVLQAVAARNVDSAAHLDPRLLLRLLRAWRYLLGLALDGLGFALSLVALRSLPLYVVQSVVASFLAVTAVTGVVLLGTRMRKAEQVALVVVVLGLSLVSLSAAPESAAAPGPRVEWLLLASAVVLVLVSLPLGRLGGKPGAWVLGGVAGMAFGVVAVSARLLSSLTGHSGLTPVVQQMLESPAAYALLVAAPLALMTYATALQRGSVVQATAPLVVGETVLPALMGLTLLGDHARPGWGVAAAAGFCLAVGAALLLSRFGEVSPSPSAV
ncbi:MAG: hypothetical protein ABI776_00315 [Nocardioidaceae bacterium]